ncbi:MAG: phosphocholine cytidylyltransferase family protein [Proteobacteria bacterium]|nr:phosphocholine cytidylyltransferase family protein [Pseudomonadota bacterium]MDA1355023.1 phosphocholine cytidylyltransferase family protein [Pseudomonadota bacterium]
MRAVIFAAGLGSRLGGAAEDMPKVLLRFANRSLLERHLTQLGALGIEEITLGVGHGAAHIAAELARLNAGKVELVHNPDYREGSVVTMAVLERAMTRGGDVLLMDGDVLYDRRMLERLLASPHRNLFLLDRDVEPGEEPMKLAIAAGHPVDFRKILERAHEYYGESVGFFRFDESAARDLSAAARQIISKGGRSDYMEEAIRDVLLVSPKGRFGFEDITGLPWIEIDFAADLARAENEILPRLIAVDR